MSDWSGQRILSAAQRAPTAVGGYLNMRCPSAQATRGGGG
jgi:hypothetical protein